MQIINSFFSVDGDQVIANNNQAKGMLYRIKYNMPNGSIDNKRLNQITVKDFKRGTVIKKRWLRYGKVKEVLVSLGVYK